MACCHEIQTNQEWQSGLQPMFQTPQVVACMHGHNHVFRELLRVHSTTSATYP